MLINNAFSPMQPSPGGASAPPTATPSATGNSGQQNSNFKIPIPETLDRLKEEFGFLQAQNQRYQLSIGWETRGVCTY